MPKATITRCYQIVARTPQVILSRGEHTDFTHLQECGAPVYKYGKCRRHQDTGHDRILSNWRRFARRMLAR